MPHYKMGVEHLAAETPPEWLKVGVQIGKLANEWAARDDLVAYVGPGAGGPAPACFIPHSAELEVNVDVAFGPAIEPRDIHLATRKGRYEFPRAVGAIAHEAFHARFSQWDIPQIYKDLAPDEAVALVLLEESRIEAQGLWALPRMRPFLKACAMDIVLGDMDEFMERADALPTATMAQMVGLVYARMETIVALRKIAQNVQSYTSHANAEGMYDSAREWARLVREVSEGKGEPQPNEGPQAEGESGEGEGSGSGLPEELKEAIREALEDAAGAAEIAANDDLADAEQGEKYEEVVVQRGNAARERGVAQEEAGKIFAKSTGPSRGDGTGSYLKRSRPPTPGERVAANIVARMLEKAKYHDREMTEVNAVLPPGRLNARALVQGVAQRERGMLVQAEPWRKKQRRMVDDPTLTVGVIVDISGSMEDAMEPMATTAYVLSEAARRVQARCAMVYYGDSVFHTLRPGEHQTEVRVYTAPDGTEEFDSAFKAVDGALNLLHGTGGRLLVIVSDGCYTSAQTSRALFWLQRCAEEGVAVIILPFDTGYHWGEAISPQAVLLAGRFDPTQAAQEIGRACAAVLTQAGARRG
jgi:hypothetical protein